MNNKVTIKHSIKGSCLCGKIHYEIKGELLQADHCHCSMCRKQHGAAFASYADFDPKKFQWLKGEQFKRIYELESGAGWCFCNECGSSLAGTHQGQVTSVALGTLDDDIEIKPESHIFMNSKANWHQISDDLTQYKERSE